jgi:hypothetical protein
VTRCAQPSARLEIHVKDPRHHPDDCHDREHRPGRPLRHDVIAIPAGPEGQRHLGVIDARIEICVATAPAVEIAGEGFPNDPGVPVGHAGLLARRHTAIGYGVLHQGVSDRVADAQVRQLGPQDPGKRIEVACDYDAPPREGSSMSRASYSALITQTTQGVRRPDLLQATSTS